MSSMDSVKEYIYGVFESEFSDLGLSKESANATLDFIVADIYREKDMSKLAHLKMADGNRELMEEPTLKSMLATTLATTGVGGLYGLAKSLLSRAKGDSIGETVMDSLKKSLAYSGLGALGGSVFSMAMPETSTIIGSNIYNADVNTDAIKNIVDALYSIPKGKKHTWQIS